jgi:nucleotide-binding universal stress UspA family protein
MPTLTATMPIVPTEGSAAFKKLVVAYDFSSYADTALDYALDFAMRQNSEVTLVLSRARPVTQRLVKKALRLHKRSART